MGTPLFSGSAVALVTPFKDNKVDFETFGKLIDFHIENGTDAIVVCGTTGEASTLSIPEHLEAIDYCVHRVDKRIKVIAGTGSNDTAHAVLMSQSAERSGADGLLMVTPYYNKTTQAGLIKHYNYIADRVNIPIILYNVPSRTGVSFTAATYAELAKHPNIVGVKEASGNFTLIAQTRALCGDDFYIWSGNDDQVVPIMALGGKGVISVAANIQPKEVSKMCHACLEGDFETAAKIQIENFELWNNLFLEVNPIPVKTAMGILNMCSADMRMPLCEMSEANTAKLMESLKKAGFSV